MVDAFCILYGMRDPDYVPFRLPPQGKELDTGVFGSFRQRENQTYGRTA